MFGEGLPDLAMIGLRRAAVSARHAQRLQGHALGIEHPEDVMIGDDEEIGWRAERRVFIGQQPRVDMTMRADDGQPRHACVQLPRHAPLRRVGVKETIFG